MAENFITIDGKREKAEIEDTKPSDESEIVSFFRDEENVQTKSQRSCTE